MKNYWNSLTTSSKIKHVVYFLLMIILIIFMSQNWLSQEIKLFKLSATLPIAIVILGCVIIGFSAAKVFDYRKIRRQTKTINSLQGKIEALEHQIKEKSKVETRTLSS